MFNNSTYFYYAMYLVGFAIMMIINLHTHKKFEISKKNAVLYTLYTYVCGVLGAALMGKIYTAVSHLVGAKGGSAVAIFGAVIFTPIFLMIFPVNKKDRKNAVDMLTPGILIILACAKFGCFIHGCCRGIVSDFGVKYLNYDETFFPVQIFEVITMLAVLALTQLYINKSKKFVPGTAYPITFAVYCVTRFLWENMRYYDTKMGNLFLGLTFWQIVSLAVFVVCVIMGIRLKIKSLK